MTDSDMQLVTDCAALAPSVHNTQPWRFRVDGETLEVWADHSRRLSYLDPSARQLHISCGAAVEFARLAARSLGRGCAVQLRPNPENADLLADVVLGGRERATPEELALAGAIARRYTDRGAYSDQPVPVEVLVDAQHRAAELGVWIHLLERPGERTTVAQVLTDGEAAEAADPEYATELTRWTSDRPDAEGMPLSATEPGWPTQRISDLPLRDFSGRDTHPRPGDAHGGTPPVVERDTLVLLGTPDDDPVSWMNAGQALGWLLLRCAADGVSAQPLGPAVDVPPARARLRHELSLVGQPQFLLRLGYGAGRPRTRRRTARAAVSMP